MEVELWEASRNCFLPDRAIMQDYRYKFLFLETPPFIGLDFFSSFSAVIFFGVLAQEKSISAESANTAFAKNLFIKRSYFDWLKSQSRIPS